MARHGTILPSTQKPVPDGSDGEPTSLYTTTVTSPIGDLILIASDRGLRAVLWPGEEDLTTGAIRVDDATHPDRPAVSILTRTGEQLDEYFKGDRREFDIPMDPVGTEFQLAVWNVLRDIPYGRTITYGEQARALGDVNKARAVGSANGRNPISIIVPCHRVVGADGSLTGYGGGIGIKEWLLRHEDGVIAQQLPFTG